MLHILQRQLMRWVSVQCVAGRQIITIADWRKSRMDSWSRVTGCSPRPQLRQHDIYPYRIKMICILFLKDVKIKHVDGERTVMKRSYNGKWISYWLRIPKKCTMYNATKRDFLTTNDRVIRGVCCPFCANTEVSALPPLLVVYSQYSNIHEYSSGSVFCLNSQCASMNDLSTVNGVKCLTWKLGSCWCGWRWMCKQALDYEYISTGSE